MLSASDNDHLTQTGADTPMGVFFRRFWVPVLLSQELPEHDGPPVRVTVMGDDLVAFRDTDGRAGLLDPRCPHRGANLFFGRNEECGIRCVYHGYTGIRGISEQDAAIQDSQGAIADRAREHLGPTDLAIVKFRRMMLEGARGLQAGVEPAAAANATAYCVRSGSALADRRVRFADVMIARFGDPLGRGRPPAGSDALRSSLHAAATTPRGEP